MIHGAWNQWLTEASGQFLGELAIYLSTSNAIRLGFLIPVGAKTNSSSDWLNKLFHEQWSKAIEAFKACPTLVDGRYALSEISYCNESIDGMLTKLTTLQ